MKRPILIFCLLIAISTVSSLLFFRTVPVKFNAITVEGKFSLSVPEYLSKTETLDSTAVLQYKNEKEQLFLLIYHRTDTVPLAIKAIFKSSSDELIRRIGQAALMKYYPAQLNSAAAMIGNIRGTVNGTNVYYRMAIIGSGNSHYEIIIGIADDNRSEYDTDMNSIIQSFTISAQ